MNNKQTFSHEWGGRTLTLETGKLAQLASGAVRTQYGDTVVLATVTMSGSVRDDIDYFPLSVEYQENLYAAGKIKGSRFIKREGRPSDLAVLNGRITDRSLRPLFNDRLRNDVQVIINVLSVDQENDPALIGLIAASAALSISPIPWDGPVAGVSAAYLDGQFILNPTTAQREKASYYILAAVRNNEIVMIEAEGKETPEKIVEESFAFILEQGKVVYNLICEMQKKTAKPKVEISALTLQPEQEKIHIAVTSKIQDFLKDKISTLFGIRSKEERVKKEEDMRAAVVNLFSEEEEKELAKSEFEKVYEEEFRKLALDTEIRVDGRKLDEIRSLSCEVDILPRTHGSALFQRGETQVLSAVTLGAPGAAQTIDGLEPEYQKRFMHHYDFPPFSVGEVKPVRGPSRRDIGHGALVEKALEAVIPPKEEFPYTIRVVSEVLMSNGSSSQASICGSTMALMAAGVPVKKAVAGIAMGLITTNDRKQYKILTDIQGIEDHSGDMDFKISGTREGVTAIQLDIKLGGITLDICRDTLTQTKKARLEILQTMEKTIVSPRPELSPFAPRIEILHINPENIGGLIGPGGKNINKIIEETEAEIDIEDDGTVFVTALNPEAMQKAKELIIACTKEIEIGEIIEGKVSQIVSNRNSGEEIGAIVDLGGNKDGMIHISEVCHCRINKVTDVLNIGDSVKVRVKEVDKEKGRISLSRKDCIQADSPDPLCEKAGQQYQGNFSHNDRPFPRPHLRRRFPFSGHRPNQ